MQQLRNSTPLTELDTKVRILERLRHTEYGKTFDYVVNIQEIVPVQGPTATTFRLALSTAWRTGLHTRPFTSCITPAAT
jgi:hypothetical protein